MLAVIFSLKLNWIKFPFEFGYSGQNSTVNCFLASYVCIPIGAIGSLSVVGTKTHISKIVQKEELGKVMSLMTALDTLVPMFTNPILVLIFNHTLDTYPGTVYQVIALLLLIPILVMMWIDIYTKRPLVDGEGSQLKQNVDLNHNNDEKGDAT